MTNSFLNIPEFMWENIFVLLNTLICGTMVAYFASTFLKKKEERTRVAGIILEKRIEAERKILSFLENRVTKNVLLCDDKKVTRVAERFAGGKGYFFDLQYSTIFSSQDNFEAFFNEFEIMFSENKLWLDESVRDHLLLMNAYFSWINSIPIVIKKIQMLNVKLVNDSNCKLACDKSYLLFGMILDNEINGLIATLEAKIVNSIYKLDLSSPSKGLGRNGMYNKNTKRILKELNEETILGREYNILIEYVVETVARVCKIKTSDLREYTDSTNHRNKTNSI